jgi:hypothetical protein
MPEHGGGPPALIPDLDGDLDFVLGQVEELLLTLSAWEDDPNPEPFVLPGALAGRIALEALNRVQEVIAPSQTRVSSSGGESQRKAWRSDARP